MVENSHPSGQTSGKVSQPSDAVSWATFRSPLKSPNSDLQMYVHTPLTHDLSALVRSTQLPVSQQDASGIQAPEQDL